MDVDNVVLEELVSLLGARARPGDLTAESSLHDLGFRSIDFAALALRVEDRAGRELDLAAGNLSQGLERVYDLQRFFRSALAA